MKVYSVWGRVLHTASHLGYDKGKHLVALTEAVAF